MDKLPPELLLHIIQLASPAATPTPSAFRVRSAALRSFALVASIWRDIAQSELLSCIVVQTAKQVALLQDTLEAKGGHGGTTQLWIGGAERTMHEGLVVELLGVCKGVQQLWLSTINGLALEDLAGCKGEFVLLGNSVFAADDFSAQTSKSFTAIDASSSSWTIVGQPIIRHAESASPAFMCCTSTIVNSLPTLRRPTSQISSLSPCKTRYRITTSSQPQTCTPQTRTSTSSRPSSWASGHISSA